MPETFLELGWRTRRSCSSLSRISVPTHWLCETPAALAAAFSLFYVSASRYTVTEA